MFKTLMTPIRQQNGLFARFITNNFPKMSKKINGLQSTLFHSNNTGATLIYGRPSEEVGNILRNYSGAQYGYDYYGNKLSEQIKKGVFDKC